MSRQDEIDALLRQDFVSFVHRVFQTVAPGEKYLHNWHIDALAYELMRIANGDINRLITTLPPRYLKSIVVSVAYVAWMLGHDPTLRIICVSYSQELANKHADDMRAVMKSAWYRRTFPNTRLQHGKSALHDLHTTKRGYRLSTSVGGTLTGRGADMVILDDINKANEIQSDHQRQKTQDWFQGTLMSRLNNKATDPIIVVQQRLHDDDLVGFLRRNGCWTELNLPAIAEVDECIDIGNGLVYQRCEGDLLHPEREDQATLDQLRLELGETAFSAQYQQRPVPRGGHIIKWDWFQTYDREPLRESIDWLVVSLDPAFTANEKSDWSAFTVWLIKGDACYLLDVMRMRVEYPTLVHRIDELITRWRPNMFVVEAVGGGLALYQELRKRYGLIVNYFSKLDDKVVRMETEALAIEQGQVYVPTEAEWLETFRDEVVSFPMGKHDDQIDSMSQFLRWRRVKNWQIQHAPPH
jgi:predicted phage terminase large subunit-like protein